MTVYAVCLNTSDVGRPDDFWIEFYAADDSEHAERLATDVNPSCAVVCVAIVPETRR